MSTVGNTQYYEPSATHVVGKGVGKKIAHSLMNPLLLYNIFVISNTYSTAGVL